MATIHLGRLLGPVGFSRTVAIKRLHPSLAKDPEFVRALLDEARLATRIRHPNVVPTLDLVATEGEVFVVMEFVLGESLDKLMRLAQSRGDAIPLPITATVIVGALHGLHAAHEACDERGEPLGIVHRDVSPHNVLVGIDGAAHVIDFGVAKASGRAQVTAEGRIKGKLSYMPPEQLMGNALDRRADVFAASIIMWEMLTGQRLFQGIDQRDVVARVMRGKVDAPRKHVPSLSGALDAIVMRGLTRDLSRRFATARDMAVAIESETPLAPASQVASWVEALARDVLAERRRRVAEIEREPAAPNTDELEADELEPDELEPDELNEDALNADEARVAETDWSLRSAAHTGVTRPIAAHVASGVRSQPAPESGRRRTAARGDRRWLLGGATVALVVLGSEAIRQFQGRWLRGDETRTVEHPAASGIVRIPALPLAKAPSPQVANVPGANPPATRPRVRPLPVSSAPTAPPATASPSLKRCDPPFWYDDAGDKRYYRECTDR
jgi:serine/threonine-protein kinase